MNQSPNLLNWLLTNNTPSTSHAQAQTPPINEHQFRQFAQRITDDNLRQLVLQARQQGIGDEQIREGLEFIMNMR